MNYKIFKTGESSATDNAKTTFGEVVNNNGDAIGSLLETGLCALFPNNPKCQPDVINNIANSPAQKFNATPIYIGLGLITVLIVVSLFLSTKKK